MLADLQSKYQSQGFNVVAVNFDRQYSLGDWTDFWKTTGAGDVIWAQDTDGSTVRKFRLFALGTEILIDRNGAVTFRSDGPSGVEKLRSEIEKVL